MNPATRILLSAVLSVAIAQSVAIAKGGKTVRRAPSAGVMLQTPNPQSALEHNNRGVELGSKGLWPDAIKEHEIALAMQPSNKDFRTNLSSAQLHYATALFNKNQVYEAIKQYRGALFVDPDNMPAEAGLDECWRKLHRDPEDANFRTALAEALEEKGLFEDAIVEYRRVVKMQDSGKSHADLGYVLLKADKPVEGFQELRIAVQKQWKNEQVNDLAQCHRKMGEILLDYAYKAKNSGRGTVGMKRLANAVTEYKRAVTLNPSDMTAVAGFIETVRECCALKPTFDNELMLAGAYLLARDFNHAKMAYELCYKLDPRRTELQSARVAYHKGVATAPQVSDELVMESLTKVQKFLQDDPDNAKWLYILGRLKQHLHDNDGAMEAYRRAEKINPLIDPDLAIQIRVLGGAPESPLLAAQQGGNGGVGGAGSPMGTGGGTTPAAGTGGQQTAAGTGGGGTPGQPVQPVAPAIDPRRVAFYAQIEQKMGSDPDGALSMIDESLQKNPADGHLWLLKGDILRKQGKLDEAAVNLRTSAGFKDPDAEDMLQTVNTIRIQDAVQKADQYLHAQPPDLLNAADQLQTAIIKAPNLPAVRRKLSEVLRQMNDIKGAEREEAKAKELESHKK